MQAGDSLDVHLHSASEPGIHGRLRFFFAHWNHEPGDGD